MDTSASSVAFHLTAALNGELAAGERLLWSASPDPRRLKAAFGMWFFAVPWTVFSLVWTGLATAPWFSGPPHDAMGWGFGIAFPLFGTPFILAGLWMLNKPLHIRKEAASTIYGLTDRRLIRIVLGKTRKTDFVQLDHMGPVSCLAAEDGWGTLTVQTGSHVDSDGDRVTDSFVIAGVPQVEKLRRLLIECLKKNHRE